MQLPSELKAWDAQTGKEVYALQIEGAGPIAVFSPDGKRLATATASGKTVKVWDAQTGMELCTLTDAGTNLVFSPDGKRLASATPGTVKLWDAQTGNMLHTLNGNTGKEGGSLIARPRVDFSLDGRHLVSASTVWDAETGRELRTLNVGLLDDVEFSPDGQCLAAIRWSTKDRPGELRVWNTLTDQELFSFKNNGGSVAFSPDGRRLATADGNAIAVWDTQTRQLLFILQGHTELVSHLVFSPDGQRLASTSLDQTLRVWELQKGQAIRVLRGQERGHILAFSPDGNRLVSPGPVGGARVWDCVGRQDQETLTLNGFRGPMPLPPGATWVVVSPDFKSLAGVSGKTVKLWDARTRQETLTVKGEHTNPVQCVAFSADGKLLASGDGIRQARPAVVPPVPGVVKMWDAKTGQLLRTFEEHPCRILSVALSPDGKRLASASEDRMVKVWDTQTGQVLHSFPTPGGGRVGYLGVAFSPDGQRLASSAKVWDLQTGQELFPLDPRFYAERLVFSPDGKRLASFTPPPANGAQVARVFDAQTGQILLTLNGGGKSVAFSPDGKRLACDGKVWDAQTGQEVLSLKASTNSVCIVAFSPDGHRLGRVTATGEVTIWDATPLPEKP
jgi:WD40 repeat protein